MKIRPIILCGGAGTRLWPKSKKNTPKQFIDWGGWTLFDKTLERLKTPIFDYPIITTNYSYLKFNFLNGFRNDIQQNIEITTYYIPNEILDSSSSYSKYFEYVLEDVPSIATNNHYNYLSS